MDNSDIPITISEIPPRRQSSGFSFFSKTGEVADSGNSNSFLSSPNRSRGNTQELMSTPKKSMTQTFIEDWLVKTATSSQTPATDNKNSMPPWASLREQKSMNKTDHSSSYSLQEDEKEDSHSIASITDLFEDDKKEQSELEKKKQKKNLLEERNLSIIADDLFFEDDKINDNDDKVTFFATASSSFSPIKYNDEDDDSSIDSALYRPHFEPEYNDIQYNTNDSRRRDNDLINIRQDRDNNSEQLADTLSYTINNEDSLPDTVPYRSESDDDLPGTIPYKSDEDSLPDTVPYKSESDDDLPDTIPYKSDEDLPDTISYKSDNEDDLPSSIFSKSDNENEAALRTSYAEENILDALDVQSNILHSPVEQQYLAFSSFSSNDEPSINNELAKSPHALDLRLIPDNPTQSTDSTRQLSAVLDEMDELAYFDTVTDEEILQLEKTSVVLSSPMEVTQSKRRADSPSLLPTELVRADKRQLRSSSIKKPTTIDDYFSLTNGLDSDIDEIGKDSEMPSYTISSNEDVKKPDTQQDHRRRPRFGISKREIK